MDSPFATDYWAEVYSGMILEKDLLINTFHTKIEQEFLGGKREFRNQKIPLTSYRRLRLLQQATTTFFPETLTSLSLQGSFIGESLTFPPGLLELDVGEDFNQCVKNLPSSLLTLRSAWSSRDRSNLPANLLSFTVYSLEGFRDLTPLPPNLTALHFLESNNFVYRRFDHFHNLPSTLTTLTLTGRDQCFFYPPFLSSLTIRKSHFVALSELPSSLTSLTLLDVQWIDSYDHLPPNLVRLDVCRFSKRYPLNESLLPTSLRFFRAGGKILLNK